MQPHRSAQAASAIALFMLAGGAIAQTEVSNDTGWTLRPNAEYVSVVNQYTVNDRTAGTNGVSHQTGYNPEGGANVAAPPAVTAFGDRHLQGLRLGLRGGAAGVEERYEIIRSFQRTFRLNTNSNIYLPTLMNAVVGVNRAAGGGFTSGSVIGSLTLQRDNGAGGWVDVLTSSHTASAVTNGGLRRDEYVGNWSVPNFLGNAGTTYRILASTRIFGQSTQNGTNSGIAGSVGTVGTAGDPDSMPAGNISRGGFMGSVAVVPTTANTNSREAVRAPTARADFGVDGTGVRVSVLEGGSIYDTHASIAAARLRFADGAGGTNAGPEDTLRNEHTLAVASIIGSAGDNTGNAGVAPGVSFRSVDTRAFAGGPAAGLTDAMGASPVVNMSFGAGALTPNVVDGAVNARRGVTLVAAADNSGTLFGDAGPTQGQANNVSTMTPPSTAWNAIHVGSVDQAGVKAPYSSFNGTNVGPFITVVAPGSFINSASVSGGTGDNASGAFSRIFVGNDYNKQDGAVTGSISGNSFAAPHVTGGVALMNQYAAAPANGFDASAVDQRVVRAIVVNSAATNGISRMNRDFSAGAGWAQDIVPGGNATPGNPLEVRRSLDPQLGGGMLDAANALRTLASGEIRPADGNAEQRLVIDAQNFAVTRPARGALYGKTGFWDADTVVAQTANDDASRGRVDYLVGDLTAQAVRATLTWDREAATQASPANLQLRLFMEGVSVNNIPGWDPGDIMLATTLNTLTENIKMLSFTIPEIDIAGLPGYDAEVAHRSFFFEVVNLSNASTDYGFVFQTVPTPSGLGLLAMVGVLASRRRRNA